LRNYFHHNSIVHKKSTIKFCSEQSGNGTCKAELYKRAHQTMGTGLWLVSLVIHTVIGESFNMRWS